MADNGKDLEELVLTIWRTPFTDGSVTHAAPRELTAEEALETVLRLQPPDAESSRVQQQLSRERAGAHHYLCSTEDGTIKVVQPAAKLQDLAVPRELLDSGGQKKLIRVVAFEVQAYTPVGSRLVA